MKRKMLGKKDKIKKIGKKEKKNPMTLVQRVLGEGRGVG